MAEMPLYDFEIKDIENDMANPFTYEKLNGYISDCWYNWKKSN